ncbi:SET methyltransferase domain containing protein [Nitzschia inconspicua]|uniref:SET methyltransferase domain containing protein n=1 Tax=Nitzschia inconspicua TaxID=303405 RepID=A0A9K3P7Z7_9STRA|nr:SET methyltransferase domain containing protein [Nitzschia inconspicua]KAG7367842.1 SET methyltransferase domain containing protein [Nitzschia inconspicua]
MRQESGLFSSSCEALSTACPSLGHCQSSKRSTTATSRGCIQKKTDQQKWICRRRRRRRRQPISPFCTSYILKIATAVAAVALYAATIPATRTGFAGRVLASTSSKPLVRATGSGSDSHLLRNNPLRTSIHTPSSSATLVGQQQQDQRTFSIHSWQDRQDRQPTRNLLLEEEEDREGIPDDSTTSSRRQQEKEFLQWCYEAWGIDSSRVEIDVFEYNDYILAMEDRIDIFCEDCYDDDDDGDSNDGGGSGLGNALFYYDDLEEDRLVSITDYPPVQIRGLKAATDLIAGEVILSIPHRALWTLSNVIDKDPALSKIMGKELREQHGWDSQIDEIPLLAVALLYHMKLLRDDSVKNSPHGPYLQILLQEDLDKSIPHLWSSYKLRRSATSLVRKIAKGIQRDVVEMYETIVLVLVEEHPNIFGEPWEEMREADYEVNFTDDDQKRGRIVVDESGDEWMFSLERFHWAFALINSRHWHLPVPENPAENPPPSLNTDGDEDESSPSTSDVDDNVSFNDQPPASMPTEEWMHHQREQLIKEEKRESKSVDPGPGSLVVGSSFLAPVADLLNFGPPCTRGVYNHTTDSFEIIATCPFRQGQEITFWYTDACEDVFMANYGFTMPLLVPKCPNANDEAVATIQHLSRDLGFAYEQLHRMDQQIDELVSVLHDCHCENQTDYLKIRKNGGYDGPSRNGPPVGPSSSISPPRDDGDIQYDVNLYPVQNRNNGGRNHHNRDGSYRNDARHAIRGRSRRSQSTKDRRKNSGGESSSKGNTAPPRRKPRGSSRKSEF